MKFGYCIGLSCADKNLAELWSYMKELGYDFIDCGVPQLISLSEEALEETAAMVKRHNIPLRSVNCLLPGDMVLCGENKLPESDVRAYISNVFSRMQKLGLYIAVFGSGKARTLSNQSDMNDLENFLGILADEADKYGVTVVVEPLNKNETNVFTSLAETAEAVKRMDHPRIKLLADSFHMAIEGEPADPGALTPLLLHTHIAEADSRLYPGSGDGKYVCDFLRALEIRGYNEGVSVECISKDPLGDMVKVMEFLRDKGFAR